MRFMLDTNAISEMIRGGGTSRVLSRIERAGQEKCFTSAIVGCEIAYGVAKKGSPKLTHTVNAVLYRLEIAPFPLAAIAIYGALRRDLEAAGKPIGPYDMLIAAHCLSLDAILVTDNESEFARVDGLTIENWLR